MRRWLTILLATQICFATGQAVIPPAYKAVGPGTAGYYLLAAHKPQLNSASAGSYNMIVDGKGELLYFKRFPALKRTCDFRLQSNNRFSYFSHNKYYLLNERLMVVDSVWPAGDLTPDNHDLHLLPNGNYLLMASETVTMNLSSFKIFGRKNEAGTSVASVTAGVIQEINPARQKVFEWHAKDHFRFAEMDTAYAGEPHRVDWTHFNALSVLADGNLLLSVRNFNEVTKISRKTGKIIWRLGGKSNDFRFVKDSAGFIGQHSPRQTGSSLLLFDNGRPGQPFHSSSAKEYQLDEKTMTATLKWRHAFDNNAHSVTGFGNVQRIVGGLTLINYGRYSRPDLCFQVIDPSGNEKLRLWFLDSLCSYRVYFHPSLPLAAQRPKVKVIIVDGEQYLSSVAEHETYIWNNHATTRSVRIEKDKDYFLMIPWEGGFLCSEIYRSGER